MGSRRSTRDGAPLESLPSGSTELYESADDLEAASLGGTRGHSFSGRRRSNDVASRASSAASERQTADTASTAGLPPAADASTAVAAAQQLGDVSLADVEEEGEAEAVQPLALGQPAQAPAPPAAPPPPPPPPEQPLQRLGSGGDGDTPTSPGAGMFSVPHASAPTTGIYGIPQEMFRIKDLDAGREYALDQRYWIKDIDTGNVYVVEAEAEAVAARATGPLGAGLGGVEAPRVTELLSGRELSLNEFESTLGHFREPQPAPAPAHSLDAGEAAAAGASAGVGASVQQAAQRSLKSFSSGATWVRASVGGMVAGLKSSPRGGAPAPGADEARGGAPPPLPAADDRQGQPVKVQVYRKSYREFSDLRLVQQLGGHAGVVWCMRFSRNGRYLASAGQDCVIRVWEVCSARGAGSAPGTPAGGELPADGEPAGGAAPLAEQLGGGGGGGLLADASLAVFQQRPYRTYHGHKQDVLDLCWSKTQFLLSASMDKTVRLWHASMDECLRVFKHTDFVTAIDFHPLDDKVFLSGSIDGKVRLWNIPEQRVASWQDVHEMVTAVTYSLDGRKAVVGTMKGKCRFYAIEAGALEYEAQLDVKNKRGQHSRGKKVTGLAFLPGDPGKLLITSNDSRVRLYDGYTLCCKYKGHANLNTQIRASFSPSGEYVACGSDDGWVYVWRTTKSGVPPSGAPPAAAAAAHPLAKEKNASYECWQANGDIVTVALFGPEACHRPVESMSPTAGAQLHQRSASLGDRAEGEAALAAARARGQVLVTAGYTGEIRVYENVGLPQWL